MSIESLHVGNSPSLYQTNYKRSECKVGILHLGYGAFHRAHQAIYIDDYMEKSGDLNWGITAVNLRGEETESFTASSEVKNGYIIKTIDADGHVNYRKVRSHLNYINWASVPDKAEGLLINSDIHFVTITVTESGYYLDGNGDLDLSANVISQEISGKQACSVYGYLANALRQRMQTIDQPISILCCDNIRANGKMLQKNLLAYLAAKNEKDLVQWIEQKVTFPCSMVDRITPRANEGLEAEIAANFGFENFDPIHSEAFMQWVLEDNFAGPFPNLQKSGVEVVADVDPYEETKIRILNGGHTALAYLAALAGYKTFDEAMFDPKLREHFDNFEKQEVLPGLQIELPFDKEDYLKKITDRFCNSAIADQLERICMDGYSKIQLYIKPTLEACIKQNTLPNYALDSIASWYVYAKRFKAGKMSVNYIEPYWDELSPLLEEGNETRFATNQQLWGELPEEYDVFALKLVKAIKKMELQWPA